MPMRLWSTVATQANPPPPTASCACVSSGAGSAGGSSGEAVVLMRAGSLKRLEIGGEIAHLALAEVQIGHVAAGLGPLGVVKPARELARIVGEDAGAQRGAFGQVGEVRRDGC